MIALDTNCLIPLLAADHPDHEKIDQWVKEADSPLATTAITLGEVLRLLTHPRVFSKPLQLDEAVDVVLAAIDSFGLIILEEPEDWIHELKNLTKRVSGLRGNDVFDCRIANILRANGVKKLATKDSVFARFSFLKVIDPTVI